MSLSCHRPEHPPSLYPRYWHPKFWEWPKIEEVSILRLSRTLQTLAAIIATSLSLGLPSIAHGQTSGQTFDPLLDDSFTVPTRSAMAPEWWACVEAAHEVEDLHNIPDHLLTAIALTESGRRTPNRSIAPWPWTINVAGRGYRYATKDQAMTAARDLLNAGTTSFDVGCMQINVRYHPRAFTSLEEAFDPLSNVMYAADFISRLRSNNRSWDRAVQLYHSYNEEFNQIYGERVQGFWSMARRRAQQGDILMLARADHPVQEYSDVAALPEGFGPRDTLDDDDLMDRASLNGLRLARAVEETRATSNASLLQIAPLAVALMQSAEPPLVLHMGYEQAPASTRAPAIERRLNQSPLTGDAADEPSL